MAKRKLKQDSINRYLSLVDPENTSVYDFEDDKAPDITEQPVSNSGGINNLASTLRKAGEASVTSALAGSFVTSPGASSQQSQQLKTPGEMLQRPGFQLPNNAARYNTLLNNNADLSRVASSVMGDSDITPPDVTSNVAGRIPTARETALSITPEEKLLATLANTNPAPQSIWRRLLAGVVKGASQVTAQDTGGSAFGKIAGNVIARAIPAVDSATQYEENKARAIERYKIESAAAQSKLNRRKTENDILNDAEQRRLNAEDRAERKRQAALLDAARLRDDKRAEAKLRLDALKDLAEDSPQRAQLVEELQRSYGIAVDTSYGLSKAKTDTPISESDVRARATSEVMSEVGANVEKIARDSTNNKPHIVSAREAMQRVLNDPNASNVKKAQAREEFEKLYANELKVNIDYTKSDVDKRIREREQQLRGTPKRTTRQSRGAKVQASPEAKATNFAAGRKVVIK